MPNAAKAFQVGYLGVMLIGAFVIFQTGSLWPLGWGVMLWLAVWLAGSLAPGLMSEPAARARGREGAAILGLFAIGIYTYLVWSPVLLAWWHSDSWTMNVFLYRLPLLLMVIPFALEAIVRRRPLLTYGLRTNWQSPIAFPFISHGFAPLPLHRFLPIALAINVLSFLPFLMRQPSGFVQAAWAGAILFSLMNAVLEEFVWRGVLLSRLRGYFGELGAVILTSLGFGLQHYVLGFSWLVCLGFAVGGYFYAAVTVRSGSLVPALLWHFVLNLLMVFGGVILTR